MPVTSKGLAIDVSIDNLPVAPSMDALVSGLDSVNHELILNGLPGQFGNAKIAVLIPCYNEAISIRKVITDFRSALPGGIIYVYDNRSTDNTATLAREAGAIVRSEPWPGKGNVVRRMFADIEADVYVMADGDATYDTSVAPEMVERLLNENLDMVVGIRRNVYSNAHRAGHGFGNKLFNNVYRRLFGPMFSDIFSGYRVFSRRFVKSFPSISSGFEIETEMSVHASQVRMPVAEIETDYGAREEGSVSKLRTFHDAFRILRTLFMLFKEIKPAKFFGVIAGSLAILSLLLGYPLLQTYMETGLVPRFPTAILVTGLMLLSAISLVAGLILDSVARGRLENKRMIYLGLASPALKDA
jgi:glycosyltransferase involved in cell wall biosynthesis